ncbi:Protein of unknown function [Pyronema omphalodes CBS 100304]|uniref:Uncharacterized protein n=1 Tax=Pyronema omphalodes (strain CBS 100304) TaxID=1076935 RepID=U4L0Q8_PYROM|nr:Protein of unknown function [Pyronema omphalodes CBS 100304]
MRALHLCCEGHTLVPKA